MHREGEIVRWESDRGFGFLRAAQGDANFFFHVRDLLDRHAGDPAVGQRVSFNIVDAPRGPRAIHVRREGTQPRQASAPSGRQWQAHPRRSAVRQRTRGVIRHRFVMPVLMSGLLLLAMLGWAVALVWNVRAGRLPSWLLFAAFGLNVATFYLYWKDKHAASQRAWRVRERTLHFLGLLGGWPAAFVAHALLNHKNRKAQFQETYLLTCVVHCIVLTCWLYRHRLWPTDF